MKDWVIRTIKTFIQVVIGVLVSDCAVLLNGDLAQIQALIVTAVAAGICAVWNIISEKLKE